MSCFGVLPIKHVWPVRFIIACWKYPRCGCLISRALLSFSHSCPVATCVWRVSVVCASACDIHVTLCLHYIACGCGILLLVWLYSVHRDGTFWSKQMLINILMWYLVDHSFSWLINLQLAKLSIKAHHTACWTLYWIRLFELTWLGIK